MNLIKVSCLLGLAWLCWSEQLQAEDELMSVDMSFLEYLGAMVEVDGQLLDATELFAQEIEELEKSADADNGEEVSSEGHVRPAENLK
ncbi:MAG: hypothetical protein NXH95_15210 [Pseudomonadaceae bacterium]|nr:hypothetical protein [Pseudomonadaceae bacterium]